MIHAIAASTAVATGSVRPESPSAIRSYRYVAIGSSETLPFGVPVDDGYPTLVARHLHVRLATYAHVGSASLRVDRIPTLQQGDIVSLFVGPADYFSDRRTITKNMRLTFAKLSSARYAVVILPPPLLSIPAFRYCSKALLKSQETLLRIARYMQRCYHRVRLVQLSNAQPEDFLKDGLHPSVLGQQLIAEQLEHRLSR